MTTTTVTRSHHSLHGASNLEDEVYDVVLLVIIHSTFAKGKIFIPSCMSPDFIVIDLGLVCPFCDLVFVGLVVFTNPIFSQINIR
jgi:hypothetical protein